MTVDMTLAERLGTRDERAIEECYSSLGPMVFGYLLRQLTREEAEDTLQQVFVELWQHGHRYDPTRSLEGFVLGIARKRAIDTLRKRRATVVPLDDVRELAGEDGRETAERHAQAYSVRRALDHLPGEQREVLRLAYFGDLSQSEIAERLGVPLGTVKARTFRGLRKLADVLRSQR